MSEKQEAVVYRKLELGENAFWLLTWALVTVGVLTLIGMIVAYHSLVADRVAKSRDPVETACALGERASMACITWLASGQKH